MNYNEFCQLLSMFTNPDNLLPAADMQNSTSVGVQTEQTMAGQQDYMPAVPTVNQNTNCDASINQNITHGNENSYDDAFAQELFSSDNGIPPQLLDAIFKLDDEMAVRGERSDSGYPIKPHLSMQAYERELVAEMESLFPSSPQQTRLMQELQNIGTPKFPCPRDSREGQNVHHVDNNRRLYRGNICEPISMEAMNPHSYNQNFVPSANENINPFAYNQNFVPITTENINPYAYHPNVAPISAQSQFPYHQNVVLIPMENMHPFPYNQNFAPIAVENIIPYPYHHNFVPISTGNSHPFVYHQNFVPIKSHGHNSTMHTTLIKPMPTSSQAVAVHTIDRSQTVGNATKRSVAPSEKKNDRNQAKSRTHHFTDRRNLGQEPTMPNARPSKLPEHSPAKVTFNEMQPRKQQLSSPPHCDVTQSQVDVPEKGETDSGTDSNATDKDKKLAIVMPADPIKSANTPAESNKTQAIPNYPQKVTKESSVMFDQRNLSSSIKNIDTPRYGGQPTTYYQPPDYRQSLKANNRPQTTNQKRCDRLDINSRSTAFNIAGLLLCNVCQKTFRTQEQLHVHKKIHKAPTVCRYCNRRFYEPPFKHFCHEKKLSMDNQRKIRR